MPWVPPKMNWTLVDGVSNDDLNRIEGNTDDLNKRLGATNAVAEGASLRAQAAEQSISNILATRVPTRVVSGKLEYLDGNTYKRVGEIGTSPKLTYVNKATGDDSRAESTGSAPFRTIARAIESLRETHLVSNQPRYIYLMDSGDSIYDEDVAFTNFLGGEIHLVPLNGGNYAAIRSLRVADCYGVRVNIFSNGRTFEFDLNRGGGSWSFPFSCDRNPGTYIYISSVQMWGHQGAIGSIATTQTVCLYNCTLRTHTFPNTYGLTCDDSTLILENISYPDPNMFNVGVSATDSIIFGPITFGRTRTNFTRTLQVQ